MVRKKINIALLIVLIVHHETIAITNKLHISSALTHQDKLNDSIQAENRVGNAYGLQNDDYVGPPNFNYKELNPVDGLPELPRHQELPHIFALPTPPDIKYDGWQPISGHANPVDQKRPFPENYDLPLPSNDHQLSDVFVPPKNVYAPLDSDEGQVNEHRLDTGYSAPISTYPNTPSDSYGAPLNNPEDHSLKSSVSQSTTSHESNGLPPPALPQFEPLHNNQPLRSSFISDNFELPRLSASPTGANGSPLPIIKANSHTGFANNKKLKDNSKGQISILSDEIFSNQNNLALQRLPTIFPTGNDISVPSNAFLDAHVPPLPSLSSLADSHPAMGLPFFQQFGFNFKKNGQNYRSPNNVRHRNSLPSLPVNNGFLPPRRPPIKFRGSVPPKFLSNFNHISQKKINKIYGPPPMQSQQLLPSRLSNVLFQGPPSSFPAGNFFGKSNGLSPYAPLAAFNANYGTPLSLDSYNISDAYNNNSATYGVPSFGPSFASSSGSVGNSHNVGQSLLAPAYAGPAGLYALEHNYNKDNNNYRYNFDAANGESKHGAFNPETAFNAQAENVAAPDNANVNDKALAGSSVANSLSAPQITANLNKLELQKPADKQALKDSYGNNIDTNKLFNRSEIAMTALESTAAAASGAASSGSGEAEEQRNIPQAGFDTSQFVKSEENEDALAIAQSLTGNNNGFQVKGTKGTYTLQIQAADDGYGADGSDQSIRHEQVLSDGLLENILAAIEENSDSNQIQDLRQAASASIARISDGGFEKFSTDERSKQFKNEDSMDQSFGASEAQDAIALYFKNNDTIINLQ